MDRAIPKRGLAINLWVHIGAFSPPEVQTMAIRRRASPLGHCVSDADKPINPKVVFRRNVELVFAYEV